MVYGKFFAKGVTPIFCQEEIIWKLFFSQKTSIVRKICKKMLYIGDKNGGYTTIPQNSESKYHGVFFAEEENLIKVLDEIRFVKKKTFQKEQQDLSQGIRFWKDGTEEKFCFDHGVFAYEKNTDDEVEILLDLKKSYDNRVFGRHYVVSEETHRLKKTTKIQKKIRVDFTKKNDERDENGEEYSFSFWIFLDAPFVLEKKWIPQKYPLDAHREGGDGERYAFLLLRTSAKKIFISKTPDMKKFSIPLRKKTLSEVDIAKNALLNLFSKMHGRDGILAGHPWFFQYWTRDEAISTKGLFLAGKKEEAKVILLNAIRSVDESGRIPNRIPGADLSSADGVGWVFFRLRELFEQGVLHPKEIQEVKKYLTLSLSRMEDSLLQNGLFVNSRLETWMDTDFHEDDRRGKRIEIQALTLEMYRFLSLLTKSKDAKKKENALREKIREVFWNGSYLRDGSEDDMIRPNLFLAYYLSPDILSAEEWKTCFSTVLPKLWCEWGGLTTLDRDHPLFCKAHTGQNNKSYHRGDSWYFLNNIVGICFLRLCQQQANPFFLECAQKIFQASRRDLLELGAKGGASEISSADHQTSEGCWNQAWSNATFLEFAEEIQRKKTIKRGKIFGLFRK